MATSSNPSYSTMDSTYPPPAPQVSTMIREEEAAVIVLDTSLLAMIDDVKRAPESTRNFIDPVSQGMVDGGAEEVKKIQKQIQTAAENGDVGELRHLCIVWKRQGSLWSWADKNNSLQIALSKERELVESSAFDAEKDNEERQRRIACIIILLEACTNSCYFGDNRHSLFECASVNSMSILMQYKADINKQDNTIKQTAIFTANGDRLRALIKYGADVHVKNFEGYTRYQLAHRQTISHSRGNGVVKRSFAEYKLSEEDNKLLEEAGCKPMSAEGELTSQLCCCCYCNC